MKYTITFLATAIFAIAPGFTEEMETLNVSEFTFEYGKPWVNQQVSSSMRAGQLTYDFEDEKMADVDLVVYYFGQGQGGGTQANIDRWIGQFQGTPESTQEVKELGDKKVTFLTAKGTYMESMGGGPFSGNKEAKENYTMLAAILPSERGDVFLKITGPTESVEAMKDAYMAFAESAFKE